jgi:hypothetical protein
MYQFFDGHMRRLLFLMVLIIIGVLGYWIFNKPTSLKTFVMKNIYIEVGESPDALIERYGKFVEVNDKNFGTKFLTMDWAVKQPAIVTIKNGNSMLRLDAVLAAMGTYNSDFPNEGISNYGISMGISAADIISHDEARMRFFDLLKQIRQAGWKRWVKPNRPRLLGENAFRYNATEYPIYSLDDAYVLSLSDWMKLRDGSRWRFYQNGVYMVVKLYRDQSRMNPDLPGAYFIAIELAAQASQWRAEFVEEDRKKWKELYPDLRKKEALERIELEKKEQLQGYDVDSNYQNPDESLLKNQ